MRVLRRDSFARADLVKDNPSENHPCQWCGNKDGTGRTYTYHWEQDSLRRIVPIRPLPRFCSLSCWEAYNG